MNSFCKVKNVLNVADSREGKAVHVAEEDQRNQRLGAFRQTINNLSTNGGRHSNILCTVAQFWPESWAVNSIHDN